VKRFTTFASATLLALLCYGCSTGQEGRIGPSQISGVVTDLNGDIVRGARVFTTGRDPVTTFTNSSGAYVLENVRREGVLVQAEITQNGVEYFGQNTARVFEGERSKNTNITIGRRNQLAVLTGVVTDRFGNRLENAHVFADAGTLGSTVILTNNRGEYRLGGLFGNVNYRVFASARNFESDSEQLTPTAGQTHTRNFVLGSPSNPLLPAPRNLEAIAWTSPAEATRTNKTADAYEAIKNMIDPRRAKAGLKSKAGVGKTVNGNLIEVDLYWDTINSSSLLGYGIYRGTQAQGQTRAIDFVRDPAAYFFADADESLRQQQNYYYEITALNVRYPDTENSESDFSNRYGVRTLGDLFLGPVRQSPLTFTWQAAPGAERYIVYVFDRYPGVGVGSIWDNANAPTQGTQLVYGGPPLPRGQRHYYIVLGVANNNDSRTISRIGEFVPN
jgi:hypothetical protein